MHRAKPGGEGAGGGAAEAANPNNRKPEQRPRMNSHQIISLRGQAFQRSEVSRFTSLERLATQATELLAEILHRCK